MSKSENSALIALNELRGLEADRRASEERARKEAEDAERRRKEAEERARLEAATEAKRIEDERIAKETAEREARDREERLRIQEAEIRARAEQEARLKEEQIRLDAQVRLEQKKSAPKWPLAVAGVLIVALAGGGVVWKQQSDQEAAEQAELAANLKRTEEELAAKKAEMERLTGQLESQKKQEAELNQRLAAATTEAERAKIQAEKERLEAEMAETEDKLSQGTGRGSRPKAAKKPRPEGGGDKPRAGGGDKADDGSDLVDAPEPKQRKKQVSITKTEDPLEGL